MGSSLKSTFCTLSWLTWLLLSVQVYAQHNASVSVQTVTLTQPTTVYRTRTHDVCPTTQAPNELQPVSITTYTPDVATVTVTCNDLYCTIGGTSTVPSSKTTVTYPEITECPASKYCEALGGTPASNEPVVTQTSTVCQASHTCRFGGLVIRVANPPDTVTTTVTTPSPVVRLFSPTVISPGGGNEVTVTNPTQAITSMSPSHSVRSSVDPSTTNYMVVTQVVTLICNYDQCYAPTATTGLATVTSVNDGNTVVVTVSSSGSHSSTVGSSTPTSPAGNQNDGSNGNNGNDNSRGAGSGTGTPNGSPTNNGGAGAASSTGAQAGNGGMTSSPTNNGEAGAASSTGAQGGNGGMTPSPTNNGEAGAASSTGTQTGNGGMTSSPNSDTAVGSNTNSASNTASGTFAGTGSNDMTNSMTGSMTATGTGNGGNGGSMSNTASASATCPPEPSTFTLAIAPVESIIPDALSEYPGELLGLQTSVDDLLTPVNQLLGGAVLTTPTTITGDGDNFEISAGKLLTDVDLPDVLGLSQDSLDLTLALGSNLLGLAQVGDVTGVDVGLVCQDGVYVLAINGNTDLELCPNGLQVLPEGTDVDDGCVEVQLQAGASVGDNGIGASVSATVSAGATGTAATGTAATGTAATDTAATGTAATNTGTDTATNAMTGTSATGTTAATCSPEPDSFTLSIAPLESDIPDALTGFDGDGLGLQTTVGDLTALVNQLLGGAVLTTPTTITGDPDTFTISAGNLLTAVDLPDLLGIDQNIVDLTLALDSGLLGLGEVGDVTAADVSLECIDGQYVLVINGDEDLQLCADGISLLDDADDVADGCVAIRLLASVSASSSGIGADASAAVSVGPTDTGTVTFSAVPTSNSLVASDADAGAASTASVATAASTAATATATATCDPEPDAFTLSIAPLESDIPDSLAGFDGGLLGLQTTTDGVLSLVNQLLGGALLTTPTTIVGDGNTFSISAGNLLTVLDVPDVLGLDQGDIDLTLGLDSGLLGLGEVGDVTAADIGLECVDGQYVLVVNGDEDLQLCTDGISLLSDPDDVADGCVAIRLVANAAALGQDTLLAATAAADVTAGDATSTAAAATTAADDAVAAATTAPATTAADAAATTAAADTTAATPAASASATCAPEPDSFSLSIAPIESVLPDSLAGYDGNLLGLQTTVGNLAGLVNDLLGGALLTTPTDITGEGDDFSISAGNLVSTVSLPVLGGITQQDVDIILGLDSGLLGLGEAGDVTAANVGLECIDGQYVLVINGDEDLQLCQDGLSLISDADAVDDGCAAVRLVANAGATLKRRDAKPSRFGDLRRLAGKRSSGPTTLVRSPLF